MKKPTYLALSLVIAGLSLPGVSLAKSSDDSSQFKDGRIIFKKLDANADDKLSAAEMSQLPKVMRRQMLATMDRDDDGKVSRKEFQLWVKKQADQLFDQLDKNDNDELTAKELQPLMRLMTQVNFQAIKSQGKDKGHKGKGHHHGPKHHFKQGAGGLPNTNLIFAMMDTNHDGYVSKKEWKKAWKKLQKRYGDLLTLDSKQGKDKKKDDDDD